MANGRVSTVEILEIVRLVRTGESNSTIAQVLGSNRLTHRGLEIICCHLIVGWNVAVPFSCRLCQSERRCT